MSRTNEELIELARAGDEQAEREFFGRNMRFAYHMAKKFGQPQQDLDDLASVASIAMVIAYREFSPSVNAKFTTFAGQCMYRAINRHLQRNKKHLRQVYLHAPVGGAEGDAILLDAIESEENIEERAITSEQREIMRTVLNGLPDRDRVIGQMYYLGGKKQRDIGELIGFSQAHVSRVVIQIGASIRTLYETGDIPPQPRRGRKKKCSRQLVGGKVR